MKKLIKIDNHYYVVDDKAEIKLGDYFISYRYIFPDGICTKYTENSLFLDDKSKFNPIIATTDSKLPLPQITNPSDELVGKEVEITLFDGNEYAFISKPISKETYVEGLPIFDIYLKSIEEKETSTKVYTLEEMENTFDGKGGYKKIVTNTLEEIAEQLYPSGDEEEYFCDIHSVWVQPAFIAGYKHCEKEMYSLEEIKSLINKFRDNIIFLSKISYSDMEEFINNNKK